MNSDISLVWFRRDLRLDNNPALEAAIKRNGPILPIYISSIDEMCEWPIGQKSQQWLQESLAVLDEQLKDLGSKLMVCQGSPFEVFKNLINETGAGAVFFNRRYEPEARRVDALVELSLTKMGIHVETFNGSLLFEPWEIGKRDGRPYKVFSAFWRKGMSEFKPPQPVQEAYIWPRSEQFMPLIQDGDIAVDFTKESASTKVKDWQPGSKGAQHQLRVLLDSVIYKYSKERDYPGQKGTSALSPHLHFGEISPRQIWYEVSRWIDATEDGKSNDAESFLRELGWREFSYYLLYHFPETIEHPFRKEFNDFPWESDEEAMERWRYGQTGYPIIDAGMRQMLETGWMHNRIRMLVASFLVKDLLISWREGARWFWENLVDADLANNTQGWQWTAGCGVGAAPYFRVFNPVTQGDKFDPNGDYVRRWLPELVSMPSNWIHRPWDAPAEVMKHSGVELGITYPLRIINHDIARKRALIAFRTMKDIKSLKILEM